MFDPASFDFWTLAALAGIGLAAGGVGGLIGIGGSIIMIPAMTEMLGEHQHLYQASAMVVNFFVGGPALIQHVRARAVMGPVVKRMLPLAAASVGIGVAASELSIFKDGGQAYLIMLFGFFVVLASLRNLTVLLGWGPRERQEQFDAGRDGWKVGLCAGIPTGLIGGLLGVGGGVIAVPLQNRVLGVPLRNAIANSAATIVVLSFLGAIAKNYALTMYHTEYTIRQSLTLAGVLIPTAILGSYFGGRLTHVLSLGLVRVVLVVFLGIAGVRMMTRGLGLLG